MPIPLQTPIVEHVGNGVTTVFAYPFGVLAADDLKVRVAGVDITSGFTVSGVGNRAGGSVTFAAAPANGAVVLLFREVQLKRDTDYQENGDLREAVLDDDFDRTMMALQDTQARFQRSITIPAGETFTSLPAASARANRVMGFGPDGEVVLISAFGGGGGAIDIVPADGSVTTQKLANDAVTADKAVPTLVEDLLGFTPADESQVSADLSAGLAAKADLAGSASQVFSVAPATIAAHALRLGQFAASTGTNSLTLETPCLGLPGGATKIVFQVGYLASRPSVTSTHSYNTPFSTACVGVWLTEVNGAQHNDNPKLSAAPGLSTFSIHSDAPSLPIYWIAVGY